MKILTNVKEIGYTQAQWDWAADQREAGEESIDQMDRDMDTATPELLDPLEELMEAYLSYRE